MIQAFSDPFEISRSGGSSKGQSRKEIRTGQALNVVAGIGGANAMRMAVPEAKTKIREWRGIAPKEKKGPGKISRRASKVGNSKFIKPVLKPLREHPKAAAAGLGVGLVGLHSAELAGDAIAARSLHIAHKNAKK